MAEIQKFRSALNGFNREDVVHYIAYLNNKHNDQVNQLTSQLKTTQDELAAALAVPPADPELEAKLAAMEERCAFLEKSLEERTNQLAEALEFANREQTEDELEAYRRAERAERLARERVGRMYDQANGALADATARVDAAAGEVGELVNAVSSQLMLLQSALSNGKNTLRDAAAALYAVRPAESEE